MKYSGTKHSKQNLSHPLQTFLIVIFKAFETKIFHYFIRLKTFPVAAERQVLEKVRPMPLRKTALIK